MDAILAFVQRLLAFLHEGKAAKIIGIIRDFFAGKII